MIMANKPPEVKIIIKKAYPPAEEALGVAIQYLDENQACKVMEYASDFPEEDQYQAVFDATLKIIYENNRNLSQKAGDLSSCLSRSQEQIDDLVHEKDKYLSHINGIRHYYNDMIDIIHYLRQENAELLGALQTDNISFQGKNNIIPMRRKKII